MREIHAHALEIGEKRQPINLENGPSDDYMKRYLDLHQNVWPRSGESVDQGRINMANKKTMKDYFTLLKDTMVCGGIAELDEEGNILDGSIAEEKI